MLHFRHHNGHPPESLIFTQNSDNPQMRLDRKKGVILETHGLSGIFLKFWTNRGQSDTVWGDHISNPNRG